MHEDGKIIEKFILTVGETLIRICSFLKYKMAKFGKIFKICEHLDSRKQNY
jgi:hypothetical protein